MECAHPLVSDQGLGRDPEVHVHTELLDRIPQQRSARAIELPRHQPVRVLDHVRFESEVEHRLGSLEPEQPAADHRGAPPVARPGANRPEIVDRAIEEHAREVDPGNRGNERRRPAGEHERVVAEPLTALRDHFPSLAIDQGGGPAELEIEAVLAVPIARCQRELFRAAPREEFGEVHTIVRGAGLLSENRHLEVVLETEIDEPLAEAVAHHPVADHDEALHRCVRTKKRRPARKPVASSRRRCLAIESNPAQLRRAPPKEFSDRIVRVQESCQ